MAKSKMCESCVHTKVCMHDKNLLGDVFVLGHPSFFDNEALYEEFKRREKEGFPCDDYMRIVRCKDCRWHIDEEPGMVYCRAIVGGWVHNDWFCKSGERRGDEAD